MVDCWGISTLSDLEAAWAAARSDMPAVTCNRSWDSSGGNRRDFKVGCPLASAAVHSCMVGLGRWLQPHLAVRAYFDCQRWSCKVTQPVLYTPFGLLRGCMR